MDLWHILNVAKWHCGKGTREIRNLLWGDCGRGEINKPSVQMASGPWPMQLVVPRAVRAAVRIDTMT